MQLCDCYAHQIVHDEGYCPLCEAQDQISDLKDELVDKDNECQDKVAHLLEVITDIEETETEMLAEINALKEQCAMLKELVKG